MRLATFVRDGREHYGLVLVHPATGEDWVFDPALTEARLYTYAARPTSPYYSARPRFAGPEGWPVDLAGLLAQGPAGLDRLRRLQDWLRRFLEQTDQVMVVGAGFPVSQVKLRAPIPRPRLVWGLVQNSPAFLRHNPKRLHANLFPQGHQRPQGTVIGPGDPIVIPAESAGRFGWNPELGVIVGQGGRDIPIERAMEHVAGLTVVTDACPFFYWKDVHAQPDPLADWFEDAMGSWGDKKSDTMCPIGPYLTTLDEIGNPYDLLITSRQSGYVRDRSHTGAMLVGIERTLSWLSSFHALQAGDIIHLASMGVDGLPTLDSEQLPDFNAEGFGPDDFVESEIERVGVLRNPLVIAGKNDWRPQDHPTRRVHPSPAVREIIAAGAERIAAPEDWRPSETRHFWTLFGNSRILAAREGLRERPYPRFLNAPAAALAPQGSTVLLPPRARTLTLGCELACVVGRVARRVSADEAAAYILGYVPLAVIHDSSFADAVIEPSTPQEHAIPAVYGRWGDGANVIGTLPVPLAAEAVAGRACTIGLDGWGEATGNTAEYLHPAPEVLAYLSRQITLFPGDVITLGPLDGQITVPAEAALPAGIAGYAAIDGLGRVSFTLDDRRESAVAAR
jgi:2-keto-4-pentenoate hydratase/2-oxohepta-3-ene-1,7-dioic acid hydratase in catechol pathway